MPRKKCGKNSKKTKGGQEGGKKRKFLTKWKMGRMWLEYDNGKMWCKLCRKHQKKIKKKFSRKMIDRTDAMKVETLTAHENSQFHKDSILIEKNTE